jgi:hypothetical protein
MKKTIPTLLLTTLMSITPFSAQENAASAKPAPGLPEQPDANQARVQLAILLDTSGSMDGLIEQAKTQLWRIVNTFVDARQKGRVPFVEVALYEYGKDSLNAESHWIRQIQPLTRDLDKVSEELFKLTTNGGEEYCGAVIKRATLDLAWDPSPDVYKAVFIAGNEPFTQGPVDAMKSCREAIAKGVIVNTIHCGPESEGISGGWKDGATLADGRFLIIDQDAAVVHIDAPQDAEIAKLNDKLNKTFVPIGQLGAQKQQTQIAQDALAMEKAGSGAAVQRNVTKASANYHNADWDLVDATKEKDFDLKKVKDEDLPEEFRGKSLEEKSALIEKKASERAEIQKQILDLNKARETFVAEKLKEESTSDGKETLDKAVISTVRDQAEKRGYTFEGK